MNKKSILISAGAIAVTTALLAFVKQPDWKPVVVKNFEKEKYLGKWYEIARFDYRFEKNLVHTTADYSVNQDGSIQVVNAGYNVKKAKWTSAKGKAKFAGNETEGALKVSFFGPFYAGYNIVYLDNAYQYAMIYGDSKKYIWLLSRTPEMPEEIRKKLTQKAEADGYQVSKLIWVNQKESPGLK